MEIASCWGVEASKGLGLPWQKLPFQMCEANILGNWGDTDIAIQSIGK